MEFIRILLRSKPNNITDVLINVLTYAPLHPAVMAPKSIIGDPIITIPTYIFVTVVFVIVSTFVKGPAEIPAIIDVIQPTIHVAETGMPFLTASPPRTLAV